MTDPNPPESDTDARNRRNLVLVGIAVVAVLVVAGGLFWFFSRDSPDEVSLEAATEQVTTTSPDGGDGAADTDAATTTVAGSAGVDGTWTVDTETGDFDFESASGSFAGFRIDEELAGIGSTEAVGRTGDVTGEVVITGSTLQSADLEVDLTTITTNEQRRDDKVQRALETSEFPSATFTLTGPVELPAGAAEGDAVSVQAPGDLTIHGETRSVTAAIDAQLVDGTAVVVGSIPVTFADFGVEVPSAPVVLSASDQGVVEFQLLLTR